MNNVRWKALAGMACLALAAHAENAEPLHLSGCETQAAIICDALTGEVVYEYNARKSMIPASLTKLVTTAAVLEEKGPQARFETRAYLSSDNALLHIEGSCDPTFDSKYFAWHKVETFARDIADALKQKGIASLAGIAIDRRREPSPLLPSKRLWEDMGNYFGSSPHALNYADNTFLLTLRSPAAVGSPCKIVSTQPTIDQRIECLVTSAANKVDSAYIYGTEHDTLWYVSGSIPTGRDAFTIKGALPCPELYFCKVIAQTLRSQGIAVDDLLTSEPTPANAQLIASSQSPTIEAIAQETNKRSINLFADALLMLLCTDSQASWDAATNRLTAFCRTVSDEQPHFYDGSGLSPLTRLSPQLMVDVLVHMRCSSIAQKYRNTLSIAGRDGTLRSFGTATPLVDRLWGKTGTMNGVVALAGYTTDSTGRELAFCIIVNGQSEPAKVVRNEMAAWLVKQLKL